MLDIDIPGIGSEIPVSEILGRDELIENILFLLKDSNLILEGDRRIGKTCILRKLQNNLETEEHVLVLDISGHNTPVEFVKKLRMELIKILGKGGKIKAKIQKGIESIEKIEIPKILALSITQGKTGWQSLLEIVLDKFFNTTSKKLLLLLDEVPWFLQNIIDNDSKQAGDELLRGLRAFQKNNPTRLRMVYTGSVAFRHILGEIRRSSLGLRSLKEMTSIIVPPLSKNNATDLALNLLVQAYTNLATDSNKQADIAAKTIYHEVGGSPYYIRYIIHELAVNRIPPEKSNIIQFINSKLTNHTDHNLELTAYKDRIVEYLPTHVQGPAMKILKILSNNPEGLSASKIKDLTENLSESLIKETLASLIADYYIDKTANDTYAFSFPLLRKWWAIHG